MRNRLEEAREVPVAAPAGPSRRRVRPATLADVAEAAGVSASTASRALNGRGELADTTRAAVLAAAAALDFRPSHVARSLRTRLSFTVGFVVPDVASPFYAAALKGAQGALETAGYRVMLMDSEQDESRELDALQTLVNHQVDGLLLATTGLSARRFEETVGRAGVPCVFFDTVVKDAGAGTVEIDNPRGMRFLVDHLVADHGHTRIALLAGSQTETSGSERREAFHAALSAHGLSAPARYERVCPWSADGGRQGTRELLALPEPPTAIVASSAELALGCLAGCRDAGVSLTDELALVAFDDPYFGDLLEPPLTAVAYDPRDVGRVAALLLVDAMTAENGFRREIRIPVDLVRRRSCGCPGEAA